MSARVGLGTGIETVQEFNRRALMALRAVDLEAGSWPVKLLATIRFAVGKNMELPPEEQQKLYELVDRYKRQIWDRLVIQYAANQIKEATA